METNAAPERVWDIWSDPATWPNWNPDVRSISLDGDFQTGTTGFMTTGQGTHQITLENVVPGRSFELVTSPMPLTVFHFHCEIGSHGAGSRLSQAVSMSGPLGSLVSRFMGERIAAGFGPILAGLRQEAERAG